MESVKSKLVVELNETLEHIKDFEVRLKTNQHQVIRHQESLNRCHTYVKELQEALDKLNA